MMEEEEHKKKLEYIRIKEWEENFDKEQKIKEQKELMREQRIKDKELEKLKIEEKNQNLSSKVTSALENFDIDKTQKN